MRYACQCARITRAQAVAVGAKTIAELRMATGACRNCGSCAPELVGLLASTPPAPLGGGGPLVAVLVEFDPRCWLSKMFPSPIPAMGEPSPDRGRC